MLRKVLATVVVLLFAVAVCLALKQAFWSPTASYATARNVTGSGSCAEPSIWKPNHSQRQRLSPRGSISGRFCLRPAAS